MNKNYVFVAIVLAAIAGVAFWYFQTNPTHATKDFKNISYSYECDEHVSFSMTPADDMTSISIEPAPGAAYPSKEVLKHVTVGATVGQVFKGPTLTFTGKGESVTLASNDSTSLNCSPIQVPDMAPFNFGD